MIGWFKKMKDLNKYYIDQKDNELKKLEERKLKLSLEIEQEKERLRENQESFEKLAFENNMLMEQYNSLKKMIIGRGLILEIEKNNLNIKEWDNLYINKKGSKLTVINKNGDELYSFEKDQCIILRDLFSQGYCCSLVVIRVTAKIIKVQLRFIE